MVERQEIAIVGGQSFMLSSALGDIDPGTRHGLFGNDTRFLSRLQLTLNGAHLVELGGGQERPRRARFYATNPELPDLPAGAITVERDRRLNGHLSEHVTVTNYDQHEQRLVIRAELGADFADVLELRDLPPAKLGPSDIAPPPGWHHAFAYRHAEFACQTLVRWSPAGRQAGCASEFVVMLKPHERWHCRMDVEMSRGGVPVIDTAPSLRVPLPSTGVPASRPTPSVRHSSSSWPRGQLAGEALTATAALVRQQAIADLRTLTLELSTGERIIGAGLPYFMTLFGRDSLLSAYQTLALDPTLAADTLSSLARHQGTRTDWQTEEEPGRIPHEVREGELAQRGARWHGRYYGTVDATPLFLIVFSEYLRRTGDISLRDRLWPAAEAALEWIDRYGDIDGDGFVEYQRHSMPGLENQGWKDSWDSVAFADGRLAKPPIALCEVQGYVYDAKLRMADLYEQRQEHVRAATLRREAALLQERFAASFWLPEERTYALALDRNKRPVDAIASNAAHCLWSGIALPEHAAGVLDRLGRKDCFSGWGLRTLSTQMQRYNPIGYHNGTVWPHDTVLAAAGLLRYGHVAAARRLIAALIEAAVRMPGHRLPELFAGHPRRAGGAPVAYPDANVPQAWAAGAVVLACDLLAQMPSAKAQGRAQQRGS